MQQGKGSLSGARFHHSNQSFRTIEISSFRLYRAKKKNPIVSDGCKCTIKKNYFYRWCFDLYSKHKNSNVSWTLVTTGTPFRVGCLTNGSSRAGCHGGSCGGQSPCRRYPRWPAEQSPTDSLRPCGSIRHTDDCPGECPAPKTS